MSIREVKKYMCVLEYMSILKSCPISLVFLSTNAPSLKVKILHSDTGGLRN